MKKLTLKANRSFRNKQVGQIFVVPAKKGLPIERFWRDRLEDAKIDGCVEIVHPEKKPKPSHKSEVKAKDIDHG